MSDHSRRARDLDWRKFVSPHMPLAPVVYLTGEAKTNMIARVRAAFAKLGSPASGTEARQRPDPEEGLDPKGDGPTLEERDAQTPVPSSRERK